MNGKNNVIIAAARAVAEGGEPKVEIIADQSSLGAIQRAEIDTQISTAKRYPRSIERFRQTAMTMATMDAETAGSCFYKLHRQSKDGGGKTIEGPSVRLAEIVASAWGNLRFAARIIEEGASFVVAQGVAHDLESNVSVSTEVRRRITTRDARRYGDDMILVTCNAAAAIALRNAIFKAVPFTYVKQVFEAAKHVAVGSSATLAERRQKMIEAFGKMSVSVAQILAHCAAPSIEDIGLAEIEDLLGVYTAIKDNETTIDEQFPAAPKSAATLAPASAPESAPIQVGAQTAPENDNGKKAKQRLNLIRVRARNILGEDEVAEIVKLHHDVSPAELAAVLEKAVKMAEMK